MRLRLIENKGCCPGCGKKFPSGEPYPDVDNCETCERFGPPKDLKEENEYAGLEDADEFQEDEPHYHPFLDQLEYKFLGSRWPEHEIIAPRPDSQSSDQYYIKGSTVFKNGDKIGLTSGPVPFPELMWGGGLYSEQSPWSWHELIDELYNIFGPAAYDDPPPGVGI